MAEILKGNPEEVVTQLTEILKKKRGRFRESVRREAQIVSGFTPYP